MVAMGGDECVYTASVSIEVAVVAFGHIFLGAFSGDTQPEDALFAIELDEIAAEDLGEFAGGGTAEHIHLPETILRSDVSLGEEEIVQGRGFDGRNSSRIAENTNFCRKAGHRDAAIEFRKRRTGDDEAGSGDCENRYQNERKQKSDDFERWVLWPANFGERNSS